MVPFLPSRIPSLLPTHRSLPPSVTGGTAVAHARDREACESEISRQKAASITQTAERRRPWSFRLTSTMACRRGQRRGGHCGSAIPFFFHVAFLFRVVSCSPWQSHFECLSQVFALRRGVCTREVRRFPYLQFDFIKLETPMPCDSPAWFILLCYYRNSLQFPSCGPTLEPRLTVGAAWSPPMFLR